MRSSVAYLGQVPTPPVLARHLVRALLVPRSDNPISILDPCVGAGALPLAAMSRGLVRPKDIVVCVDVAKGPLEAARQNLAAGGLVARSVCADYLETELGKFDYAMLNPPYVRQERINKKKVYGLRFRESYGIEIPARSNLYVYFVVKALEDLKAGGSMALLVDASWRYTDFGKWLRDHLLVRCDIDESELQGRPFPGHLNDATAIIARKHSEKLLMEPQRTAIRIPTNEELHVRRGLRPLQELFEVKRGLSLKQADVFKCGLDDIDRLGATPFLKKVGRIPGYSVPRDHPEAALLIGKGELNDSAVAELHRRLLEARKDPERNKTVLSHAARDPGGWVVHPTPPRAPIVLNYYLRDRIRHLLNPDRPFSDNFYGLTPRCKQPPILAWLALLNSNMVRLEILSHARYLGDGLSKIQLSEYRRVHIPDPRRLGPHVIRSLNELGARLRDTSVQGSSDILEQVSDVLEVPLGFRR